LLVSNRWFITTAQVVTAASLGCEPWGAGGQKFEERVPDKTFASTWSLRNQRTNGTVVSCSLQQLQAERKAINARSCNKSNKWQTSAEIDRQTQFLKYKRNN